MFDHMILDFLKVGLEHILDPQGIDHILFIATLCSLYFLDNWKRLLVLVTAFTAGHCITLALSSVRWINVSPDLVEFCIPLTIIITALYNIYVVLSKKGDQISTRWHYILTLMFGLIHGLGFSNFFRAMFDESESILMPLLGFNIGLELGQLVVVTAISILGYLLVKKGPLSEKYWVIGVASVAIIMSTKIMIG
jgi:HupE / UreJ protein